MTYPAQSANTIILWGRWYDHLTRLGMDADVAATPLLSPGVPAPVDGATPNLRDQSDEAEIKSRKWTTRPLASGLWALPLLPNNDTQLSHFGGYRLEKADETAAILEISEAVTTETISQEMVDALAQAVTYSGAALLPIAAGDTMQMVWEGDAAVLSQPAPVAPEGFLNSTQTRSLIAAMTWNPRGAWSNPTTYLIRDVVRYQGSAYIAIVDNAGVTPGTDAAVWTLVVSKGDTGPQGPAGPTGATGATGSTGATGAPGAGSVSSVDGDAGPAVVLASDGAAGTATKRSLGAGATQAAAGNDSRITGAAQKSANLSDLGSATSARTNLGLAAVAASGSASDITTGTLPQSVIPSIALTEFLGAVTSQAAMLALTGQRGDWCTRADLGTDWQLIAEPSSTLASWRQMTYPASPVNSVNGRTGSVTGLAEASDVAAGLAGRQPLDSDLTAIAALDATTTAGVLATDGAGWIRKTYTQVKTALGLTKGDVGLGNVDNTADTAKPVSAAQQTALDGKASVISVSGRPRNIVADGAVTGSTNNATVIQAAIDAVATVGGGTVVVPKGAFLTGPLQGRSRVRLVGEGWGSQLKLINAANASLISLVDGQVEQFHIEDMWLDGNGANQTAGDVVNLDNTGFSTASAFPSLGDPDHFLRRVSIVGGYRHGVYVAGSVQQSQFESVFVSDCGSNSFYLAAPDCHLVGCVSRRSGVDGFYIAGNSNRLLNCKAFLAGRLDAGNGSGFRVQFVSRADLMHCEAQDNRQHGFVLNNTVQSMLIGKADRNGLGADPVTTGYAGDGVFAAGVTKSTILLTAGDRAAGTVLQRWGYNCGSGNDGNIVQIAVGSTAAGIAGIGSWGPSSQVAITYGGAIVSPALPTPLTTQTSAYTLTLADSGTEVAYSSASAGIFTVPANASVPFPIGATVELSQLGAGQLTIAGASGVTVNSRGAALKLAGQHGQAALRKTATDTWRLIGDVVA